MSFSPLLIRTLVFITLGIVWYFAVWLIAAPLTLWYVYNFRAYELVVLGLALDGYFLSAPAFPYYTVGFLGLCISIELLKPQLRSNQQQL